jgi:hypothetical protein
MDKCHDISTPLEAGIKFSNNDCFAHDNDKALMEDVPYFESCGSLIHSLVYTRPDVTYSVNICPKIYQILAQYIGKP